MSQDYESQQQEQSLRKTINNLKNRIVGSLPVKHDAAVETANTLSNMLPSDRSEYIKKAFGQQYLVKVEPMLIQLATHEQVRNRDSGVKAVK